jgi:ABC-type tungstate transport system permease subunit
MKFFLASLGLSVVLASSLFADTLMMATTTSTEDTGLLDYLNKTSLDKNRELLQSLYFS